MCFDECLNAWRNGDDRQQLEEFWFGPQPGFLTRAARILADPSERLADKDRRELEKFAECPDVNLTHQEAAKNALSLLFGGDYGDNVEQTSNDSRQAALILQGMVQAVLAADALGPIGAWVWIYRLRFADTPPHHARHTAMLGS